MKLVRDLRGHLVLSTKGLRKSTKKKVAGLLLTCTVLVVGLCGTAFASGSGGDSTTDFSAITNALKSSVNASQVAAIIGTILAATVGIAILWWGARKLVHSIVTAFKTGKIKF